MSSKITRKTTPAAATKASETADVEPRLCGCGCGEQISQRANFRPGHDARHAGNTGRALAANPKDKAALADLSAMSPALRSKAERVRDNAVAKAAKAETDSAA